MTYTSIAETLYTCTPDFGSMYDDVDMYVYYKIRQRMHKKNIKNAAKKSAEHRSCVKVEVAVLGSPSLISLMVSVDVKQQ